MGILESLLDMISPKTISPLPEKYTSPTPIPTPTLIPQPSNPYMGLLAKYFSPQERNNASNVMFKESSFRPDVVNVNTDRQKSKDYGLFQGNDYWQRENFKTLGITPQDLLDPETAVKFAAWLHAKYGWRPWSSSRELGLR